MDKDTMESCSGRPISKQTVRQRLSMQTSRSRLQQYTVFSRNEIFRNKPEEEKTVLSVISIKLMMSMQEI
jgi:hypothetical protein